MDLERLIAALAPADVVLRTPVEVLDLAYDARDAAPGTLFFCVPGTTRDGHEFAADAVARGAVALVVERTLPPPVPQLVVADARAAMAVAADAFFGRPTDELEVAGITGTSGKTTTAFLLHAILDAAGRSPGLVGTIETRIGSERRTLPRTTPEAIDLQRLFREMLEAGNRSAVIEASSHASELRRLDRVRLRALAFTNLSHEHLDFHRTMARYFEAKRRLFLADPRPRAAVGVDDEWGRRLAAELPGALTFGLGEDAALRPGGLELTREGARFRAGGIDLRTQLRGRFNVANVLAAVAIARLLEVGDEAIAAGVAAVRGVPGRLEPVDEGQPFAVLVDYAHKPEALANVLREARDLAGGRVLVVFGAGGDRDREKRPLMGRIAAELADVVVVTSDNPRSEEPQAIVEEILAGTGRDVQVELDRRAAIEAAVDQARAGDVVVIAGKGHEPGQEIAGEVLPFDDRAVAREALRKVRA
ncbi:MAG TPA: UDP-N-acetylmuramoyl-L-alanyl-D-glutamate--2,6-diaminopimelate ligase [Gaiellaceae bacterium]|nr:UDP-N-acetylmuramoyl-L-alanyl-D-glutamate--2,6-diaminopimelate ligase [Gaiellaceae bacterium]